LRIDLAGGYRTPESEWTAIQEKVTEAMTQLEAAMKPVLKNLKLSGY